MTTLWEFKKGKMGLCSLKIDQDMAKAIKCHNFKKIKKMNVFFGKFLGDSKKKPNTNFTSWFRKFAKNRYLFVMTTCWEFQNDKMGQYSPKIDQKMQKVTFWKLSVLIKKNTIF